MTDSSVQHITSRENALISRLRRLSQEPLAYRKQAEVWLEGDHLCRAALARGLRAPMAEVVRAVGASPAVLLKNHGVFALGSTARAAVKAAVMTEDAARTVFLANQLGVPHEIPIDEVERAHRRYVEQYGQVQQ